MTTPAGPRRVARMEDMSDAALRCHAFNYPWDSPPAIPFRWWNYIDALLLRFRCPSCGSVRRDVRYQRVPRKLVTRIYEWADDYLAAFPASRQDYVDEWFARYELPPDDVAAGYLDTWTGGGAKWAPAEKAA